MEGLVSTSPLQDLSSQGDSNLPSRVGVTRLGCGQTHCAEDEARKSKWLFSEAHGDHMVRNNKIVMEI